MSVDCIEGPDGSVFVWLPELGLGWQVADPAEERFGELTEYTAAEFCEWTMRLERPQGARVAYLDSGGVTIEREPFRGAACQYINYREPEPLSEEAAWDLRQHWSSSAL